MVRNQHKKEIEEYVLAGARKAGAFGTPVEQTWREIGGR
jgi:hypothetical protein